MISPRVQQNLMRGGNMPLMQGKDIKIITWKVGSQNGVNCTENQGTLIAQ
jgi:hypothetical protein